MKSFKRISLVFKLMGAFMLVIALGALVISVNASRTMQSEFSLYTTRSSQVWSQRTAQVLVDYYSGKGSWEGVDAALQTGRTPGILDDGSGQHGMGPGMGSGQGKGMGQGGGMWGMQGQRMILVDLNRVVVSDTLAERVGQTLTPAEISTGTAIVVNGVQVGTLVVQSGDTGGTNSPAGLFLTSVNRSIIISVVAAGLLGLVLGAVLFVQITAPLRQLRRAADAISRGELSQRVSIHTHDEFEDLGQAFNQMAETLARVETQRKRLIADVAHELRTPVTVIQANLEAMLDGVLPLDSKQVASVHDETLHLNRLIGDLRLLSIADAGELKLEIIDVDLAVLIQQVVERGVPQAAQKNITLQANSGDGLGTVQVDPGRVTQVLSNLIGNALRYTPEGGTILVEASGLDRQPGWLQVSVTDSGPGIPAEDQPYIFDRFYRADRSRARMSGGSGLGLAIVRQLVEAHGGKVEVVSPVFPLDDKTGFGTRFLFTLPRYLG